MTAARALPFLAAGGELGRLIGAHDWAAGPLGPLSRWPGPLRAATGIVLQSPQPMLLWVGPELVALYNDAFAARAGTAHPDALGRPGALGFAEVWPVIGPAVTGVLETGTGVRIDEQPLVLHRGHGPEETHWTLTHSPVPGEDGEVLAVLTTTTETTDRAVAERRRETLRALGDLSPVRLAPAGHTAEHVAVAALDALALNPRDVPFAAVCRPVADGAGAPELRVVTAHGLPEGLPPLPATDRSGSAPAQALRTGEPVVVRGLRDRFPGAFPATHELGPLTPDAAVVLPLGAGAPAGVLVLGVNPYRPLDDDQLAFLHAVENQVSAALADASALDAARDGDAPADEALSSALFQERERYRTLVTQAPVGIWVADRRGTTTFVNDQIAQLWGRPAVELTGAGWTDQVHPDDREAAAAGWAAAVRGGTVWESTYRIVAADGTVREVRTAARPLRDPAGGITGFLATTADITEERRAEQIRRDVATEHAARKASEAAAARLRAMVQGLAAIVWEAEWHPEGGPDDSGGLRFTFVSDRAEELLGHPAARWCDDPDFWPAIIHPDDRDEALAYTDDRTAAGVDHDLTYRAVAIDGRVLWLHQVVHVVTGPDGAPVAAQGLTVDVTEQKRAERSAALLAETGRLVTQEGGAEERLGDLARLVVHELGDAAVVALVGPDGLLHRAAVEHDHPSVAAVLRAITTLRMPPSLAEALAPGVPAVMPITEELVKSAVDDPDAAARIARRANNALVVPLVVGDQLAGVLAFVNIGAGRYYHHAELDLAAELGRRASMMLASDRRRTRERRLQQVSADLASAGSVLEAARLLVARLPDFLGAAAVSVYLADPDRGLRLVHAAGYAKPVLGAYSALRLDEPVPIAVAARTGEPVWIRNREEWARDWPKLLDQAVAADRYAGAALPLAAVGRVVGAIGLSFPTERAFPPDERDFVLALVAQAAPAFERAAAADQRRVIAETLQKSLLPPTLPRLERLPLASRYLPGARGSQAGGDWYDVLPLDEGRVAIAVGDVVGQGARAAAIMGQLRSVLSGYLLEGHAPEQALERLDRFAGRVPDAIGSTVACLVLDPETGELVWARAGHPPPLVTGPDGCRPLDDATGTVLGVRARPPYTAGTATIAPGESIVLYTDGLVERRGEIIDEGIDRLAAIAARHHALAPEALTDALLTGALAGHCGVGASPDPADDVALIVARLVPAPLRLVLPAEAAVLRELRAAVLAWASAVGIDEDDVYDLQLAVGEAAANAVEHAYRGHTPGPMSVELTRDRDGGIDAHVRDEGSWRPIPEEKGYRGRGLELIRDVSRRMRLHHGPDGTEVRFTLPPSGHSPASAGTGPATHVAASLVSPDPPGPATLHVADGGASTVEIRGELDLAGVRGVGDELLACADAGGDITVDLRATTYLASAGIAMLVEADRRVRAAGGRLRVLVAPGDLVRRALALSGVDGLLDVLDGDGPPVVE
ncbi:SpoIIE family protein phosphatase [Pseudonocardia sp. DSM 110487]|uniref:SpoIIE family protein phosphatase n=1 Tax=Pseudonocardia sp. DSM 110487 TaxID=2865833 RepID=UPI001C6A47B7|nr:SpoIIE family protein phosphatase [Pseudonocardia sp. DSM 110487]QYN31908.1 SpoIIE family protein phosphatase [Pseudonocardia sp. DSM 110487]